MPKTEIDYSNTIIYKITCKDVYVNDLYVGHTTNFVQRKHAHKNSCINEKSCNYKCKLYDAIRNNGGWDNWQMEIIGFYNCADHYEARKKEQEFFISLNSNLNSIEPFPKPKVINTIKEHCKPSPKISYNFYCEKCEYKCCKQSEFIKHTLTNKHKILQNLVSEIIDKTYKCDCGKEYKHSSTLYAHKKICNYIHENTDLSNKDNLITMLIKQNSELMNEQTSIRCMMVEQQNKILEIAKKISEMI